MRFEYAFRGSSAVSHRADRTELSFSPDLLRPPTFFSGKLRAGVAFREAMSALHDVVISDLKWKPKARPDWEAWLATQEARDLAEIAGMRRDLRDQITQVNQDLTAVRERINRGLGEFHRARQRYFDYLWQKDRDAWIVLDPVISVHPDGLFFECFSQDESSYGRLDVSYNRFDETGERACGTTNVDYSAGLYDAFQKIRSYKETRFTVDPGGFEVATQGQADYKEVKIDLPDSWVRGFLQVSSAMTLPAHRFDLHPMDLQNILFALRQRREQSGPRSLRYLLEPGQPVRVVLDPWNQEIACPGSIYTGDKSAEVRVWGRRRLAVLKRLLPSARRVTVHLLGRGLPSFYVVDLGDITFTLGLSGWTANDWSVGASFDLLTPREDVDGNTLKRVFDALSKDWMATPDAIAARLGLAKPTVHAARLAWTQAGRAVYDLNQGSFRLRELSRTPLPLSALRFASPREEAASALLARRAVRVNRASATASGGMQLQGTVRDGGQTWEPALTLDGDDRMVDASCTCAWHRHNRLFKGPCAHLLALRLQRTRDAR